MIATALWEVVTVAQHTRALYSVHNNFFNLPVALALQPDAVKQVWRVCCAQRSSTCPGLCRCGAVAEFTAAACVKRRPSRHGKLLS